MRDDTHQSSAVTQLEELFDGALKRFAVEGTEAFVDKERVDPYPARESLNDIRESKREGERGLKALAPESVAIGRASPVY